MGTAMAHNRTSPLGRWPEPESRRPFLLSLAVALTVTTALAVLVLRPSLRSNDRGPRPLAGAAVNVVAPGAGSPTAAPTRTATPWPRRPRGEAPPPEPTATTPSATATERATATARATAVPLHTPTATVAPASPTGPGPLYLASAGQGLDAWTGPNWSLDDGALVNDGRGVDTAPWISAPALPKVDGAYAIEVEIRVLGTARGYCEQNFGIVAIAVDGGTYFGAGLLFACDEEAPLVRITDATDWTDGYNRDRTLASRHRALEAGWHTFRLEIRSDRVRLLIDGELVLEAERVPSRGSASSGDKVGMWSQGVQLAVRRVSIEPIADA
jgi:hypothetical protein